MRLTTIATCSLNQWAVDFTGNLERIQESISIARSQNARFRVGPELETTGYGCEDHFHEPDTFLHSWELIATLIQTGYTDNILVDIGAPVLHRAVPYNARVLILNRKILLIRPKTDLAGSGNYREPRWFRSWPRSRSLEPFVLPDFVRLACNGQLETKIGYAFLELNDGVTIGCEICEELWTANPCHSAMFHEGVDIIANGSASHHALRKMHNRVNAVQAATKFSGGVYLYANQLGCDGGRLYYDGGALAVLNGQVLKMGKQFWLGGEVDVVVVTVDLDEVVARRIGFAANGVQAADKVHRMNRIRVDQMFSILSTGGQVTRPESLTFFSPEEEIAYASGSWLWDYLRRSGLNGFFLPLSGGSDSSATAAIVGGMCQMVVDELEGGENSKFLLKNVRNVTGSKEDYAPSDSRELAGRIFHTMYMGCGEMSSKETRQRAENVAKEIGAWHKDIDIDAIVASILTIFHGVFGKEAKFVAHGGSKRENLALQCVQARVRMVVGYLFAQLILWARGRKGGLLVLGSANVDEGLRGYLTKYDCSSADLNPIGGVCKKDLKSFLEWASTEKGLGYSSLCEVVRAKPSAELEPRVDGREQTDEEDMGMTYEELGWYGKLRKLERCGPWSMYERLKGVWGSIAAKEVAKKVKKFWRLYGINRHKMTVLTPSLHAENYSPEDCRFDLRQFLYNSKWSWQFDKINRDVKKLGTSIEAENGLDS